MQERELTLQDCTYRVSPSLLYCGWYSPHAILIVVSDGWGGWCKQMAGDGSGWEWHA